MDKKEGQPQFDCFAYDSILNRCICLKELYCKKGKCKFYKTDEQYRKEFIEW